MMVIKIMIELIKCSFRNNNKNNKKLEIIGPSTGKQTENRNNNKEKERNKKVKVVNRTRLELNCTNDYNSAN